MIIERAELIRMINERDGAPRLLDLETLPEVVETNRDARLLEGLGISRGDLLKHYGDTAITSCGPTHGLA